MPKYLIEREIPGAGDLSPQQLQAVSQTSCGVLQKLGPQIQGGFPANRISQIKTMIDSTTAE